MEKLCQYQHVPYISPFIVKAVHASNRGFDQSEIKASVEWRPDLGSLNRPKGVPTVLAERELDQNPQRPPKVLMTERGFEVLPLVGIEAGDTYRWKDAPAGMSPNEDFVRGYFRLNVTIDFTRWLRFRLNERFYLRSEAKNDRLHNYVNVSLDFPVAPVFDEAAHGVFVGFEKGALPPFSTPDVNAFKVGYRIQWTGWFDRYR